MLRALSIIVIVFLAGCALNQPTANHLLISDANAAEPAVASSVGGDVFVVWVEHESKDRANVLLRRFNAAGDAKGERVQVNPAAVSAKTWRGDPPTIRIGPDGSIYVGWTATIPGARSGTDLFLSVSRDGGHTFDTPVKINDDTAPASHGMHSMALGGDGRIYMAWLDERYLAAAREPESHKATTSEDEPDAELYLAVSDDGGRTFSPNRRLAANICPCCKVSTVAGDGGRIYIGWRQVLPGSYRHIAVASSTDGGLTFTEPVIVSDDGWKIAGCPVSGPSLQTDGDALDVIWFAGGDTRPHGIYRSRSNDGGRSFSAPKMVNEGNTFGTPVLLRNTAVWSDLSTVYSKNIGGENAEPRATNISAGQSPAAVYMKDNLYIVSTTSESGKASVWLDVLTNVASH